MGGYTVGMALLVVKTIIQEDGNKKASKPTLIGSNLCGGEIDVDDLSHRITKAVGEKIRSVRVAFLQLPAPTTPTAGINAVSLKPVHKVIQK